MKNRLFITVLLLVSFMVVSAQETVKVKFTATDQSGAYCPFTEVNVSNVTKGWTETLLYPDTVISLTVGTGLEEYPSALYRLGVAWPNPFTDETRVPLELFEAAEVQLKVFCVDGTEMISQSLRLETGIHHVVVRLANPGLHFLVVTTPWGRSVVKLLNNSELSDNVIKVEPVSTMISKGEEPTRLDAAGGFSLGDMMSYVGKTVIEFQTVYSTFVTQEQYDNETIVLNFVLDLPLSTPIVSTNDVTSITQTTAIVSGNVAYDGGATVTERGLCWGLFENPTLGDGQSYHTNEGSGVGQFTRTLTNLTPNTTYYVQAYAINSEGTAYGGQKSFTTTHESVPIELCTTWGMSRDEVISFGNAYKVVDNAEDVVAFAASSYSRDTLMMYLFELDSLYCTTILVSSGNGGYNQLAAELLSGYYFMETQNEMSVYMNESQTTVAVSKTDNNELAVSWVALPQLIVDTIIGYTGVIAGHEYVDLGLSVKWATCNIGADVPEDVGYFFQNGETHPEINGPFQWYTYDYWTDLNGNGFVEPDTEIDFLIPDISGSQYDAARVMWTETWRMPTQNEIQELINNCQIESVVEGGKNCFRITGTNGQSILLPASGYKDKQNTYGTSNAYIWSSTRGPWEDEAYGGIIKSNGSSIDHYLKSRGLTIRPVTTGQSSSVTLNDFLGEYSVTAYNRDTQQYETWTGTNIATFTNSNTNTTWIKIEGLIEGSGYEFYAALGEYSEEHHCIRLYGGWHFTSNNYQFYFIDEDPDVLYYASFFPIYQTTGFTWYYLENGSGYNGSEEAWLSMCSDGTLSLGPSEYPDDNGRFANGFVFDYYQVEDNSYAGRFYRYTDVKLTKTSKTSMTNNKQSIEVGKIKHDVKYSKGQFDNKRNENAKSINTIKSTK